MKNNIIANNPTEYKSTSIPIRIFSKTQNGPWGLEY